MCLTTTIHNDLSTANAVLILVPRIFYKTALSYQVFQLSIFHLWGQLPYTDFITFYPSFFAKTSIKPKVSILFLISSLSVE